jgi:uncharacterized protein (DUF2252 family)
MTAPARDLIASYNQGRDASRLALKYQAMRDNPFSFLRGTAHLFHERLGASDAATGGPAAWICGDLHLENFGTYLGGNGLTYFDINDFDESALAPCSWDVVRLVTSLLVAAPIYDIKRAAAVSLGGQAIAAYRAELATGKPRWIERKTADGVIGALIDSLRHRDADKFVLKRTSGKKGETLDIASEKMQAVSSEAERQQVRGFVESRTDGAKGPQAYRFRDIAYRIAGTGSLGIVRYVVLVERLTQAKGLTLLDLKAALPSAVAPVSPVSQPSWNNEAHRVVGLQSLAQAIPPALLQAVTFGGRSYVFKELQPSSDRLDLDEVAKDESQFAAALSAMAALTAWAHLRCSGRLTAAAGDDLVAWAQDKGAAKTILQAAQAMESVMLTDWADFCEAFDAGAFAATMQHLDRTKGDEAA